MTQTEARNIHSHALQSASPAIDAIPPATVSTTNAQFAWAEAGIGCTYTLLSSSSPYDWTMFYIAPSATSGIEVNILGNPAINWYFRNQVACLAGGAISNIVGEFDFAIVPGN